MECARMLKLGNLAEHLEELLHQAQEKAADLSGVSARLSQGGDPEQERPISPPGLSMRR